MSHRKLLIKNITHGMKGLGHVSPEKTRKFKDFITRHKINYSVLLEFLYPLKSTSSISYYFKNNSWSVPVFDRVTKELKIKKKKECEEFLKEFDEFML